MIRTLTLNPCLDVFYRLPRLEAGTVNRAPDPKIRAGGKGLNVSREVLRKGTKTRAYVLLGGENGRRLESLMAQERIPSAIKWVEGETRSNLAIATDSESYKINTPGSLDALAGAQQLTDTFVRDCEAGDIAVISGGLPPGVPVALVARAIEALRAAKIPVWLDASGELLLAGVLAQPTGIKPNIEELEELCRLSGIPFSTGEPTPAARALREKHGVENILLTMGARGAALINADGTAFEPPRAQHRGHATGAGDAFLGGYLSACARGASPQEALAGAIAAGERAAAGE